MKRPIASFACGLMLTSFASLAAGQSLTTGAITGTVVDQSGAVMASVVVIAKNVDTGATRETQTAGTGNFLLAQLDPGRYEVTAQSAGFEKTKIGPITVAVSGVASLEFKLKIGSATVTVEVKQEAPLIEPSNPNTTTTFTARQLAGLPLEGNDLNYVAVLAPGAIMNAGASGNPGAGQDLTVNGLPAGANDITIDGLDTNDPRFNIKSRGASGLQLGLNAMEEVSVNTQAYSADQGRTGGAQINYVTKSGSNAFHGNAWELWNGSSMNANNFFLNMLGKKKPRSNVNQFGASLGGPIKKDKLFFFVDFEGVRIVLSSILNSTVPTPAYQAYVLQQLPLGGKDTVRGTQLPPQPGEVQLYQNMFKLMGDTSQGTPLAKAGCPFDVGGGTPALPNAGNGCANRRTVTASPSSSETLFTIKLNYNLGSSDSFWYRFQLNQGKAVSVDAVSSVFNSGVSLPIWSSAAGWTHIFNPSLVNQFNPSFSYRSAILTTLDASAAQAAFPLVYSVSPFTIIGGTQYAFPSGFATTGWQLNDNLTWSFGRHTLKLGENMLRELSTSASASFAIPLEIGVSLPEFTYGAAAQTIQSFPKSIDDRYASIYLDTYAMDTFKLAPRLTLTVGIRAAWDSNLVSRNRLFSRLNGTFLSISHDVNRPLSMDILSDQEHLFPSTPLLQWEPRFAIAYQPESKTLIRAGFGVFGQPVDGQIANTLRANVPSSATFNAGLLTGLGGIALLPGLPNSAVDAAVAANQRFQAGFNNGTLSCKSPLASQATCLPVVAFNTYGPGNGSQFDYPYNMQWSLGVERGLTSSLVLTVAYRGTRALKMAYGSQPNGFQTVCQGCFAPLPFGSAPDLRFSTVGATLVGANSSYNSLQVSSQKGVGHGLSFQVNYTYSHCLDTVSNGGDFAFNFNSLGAGQQLGALSRLYGNCDYDIRHSVNGSYTYELPLHSTRSWLNGIAGGWQVSGTVFLRSGLPFSVRSASLAGGFTNTSPFLFANAVSGQDPYSEAKIPGVTLPGTIQWLNPNAFQSVVNSSNNSCFPVTNAQNCQDGDLARNSLRGPGFSWADFSIGKRFRLTERVAFKFDAQFYNVFNHPNFDVPSAPAGIPGITSTLTGFGTLSRTIGTPSSLLGAPLIGSGGDASVRMIGLRGAIQF